MILFAGRNAAGGEDQIMIAGDLLQPLSQRSPIVAENAEIADLAAQPSKHRHQHEAVGIK